MSSNPVSKMPFHNIPTGPTAAAHGSLPKVELPGENSLQRIFDQRLAEILGNAGLFRRGILPVFPWDGRLVEMLPSKFITWATQFFLPTKTKRMRDGSVEDQPRDMNEAQARCTLADTDFINALPVIKRIRPGPLPLINGDGHLSFCTPGYVPSSKTYVFCASLTPQPPDPERSAISHLPSSGGYLDDSMTLGEAFWYLQDLHRAFPFSDWNDEVITPPEDHPLHAYDRVTGDHRSYQHSRSLAVHIGAMLSIFASGCVPREASRMGFIYNANMQRSGKSLLVKLAVSATHGPFKGQSWRDNDESLVKLIDSEIVAGSPYICFDNVKSFIESQTLESLITAPVWTGRHLGRTEMFTEENNAVLFLTGNNVSVGTDIAQRTLWCELFCEEADPQARSIEGPIIDDVWLAKPENRRQILSALWSIVRHWDHNSRPQAKGKLPKGFETWSGIIGGMVEFAGFGDMFAAPKLDNAGDTEADHIASLVRHLWKTGAPDYTYKEIVHCCWENEWFPWNLHGREEFDSLRYGDSAKKTIKLNDQCTSRMGLLLRRHSGESGMVHSFIGELGKEPVRVKFICRGNGRSKRFSVTPI